MATSGLFLSDEKEQFQKLAKDFSQGEIESKAEHFDIKPEFPSNLVHKAWELGLVNSMIGDDCDGLGLDILDVCVILEELAAGCSGIAGAIESSAIAVLPLVKYASAEQKAKFLKPLVESPFVAGYASSFLQKEKIQLVYKQEGSEYVLTGRQEGIFNGGHAAWYLVCAKDASNRDKTLLFIVPGDSSGLQFEEKLQLMGRKALSVRDATFTNVRLSESNLINAVSKSGIESAANLFIAAGATGVARSAMHLAIEYSKQRQTFGRPIAQHQAVNFMLADMAKEIETARLLIWQAASVLDKDGDSPSVKAKSLAARAFAQDMAMKVTTDAVQVLGGYGYTREYKVEKLMRDAKVYQVSTSSSSCAKAEIAKMLVNV